MTTKTYIAEKYAVAKAIASVLPGPTTGGPSQGWFEKPDGTRITWSVGHILELCMPEDYDPALQRWRIDDYPVFPEEWKLKPIENTKAQFKTIQKLLRDTTVVVHAGDPDREGQLLIDEILEFCGYAGKVLRILPNDNERTAIAAAVKAEHDNTKFKGLYEAGKARQRADFLVGINGTRVATQGLGDGRLISVGRVQTVVVWLVVKRDREIEKFSSANFYEFEIDVKTPAGEVMTLTHAPALADRIWDKSAADGVLAGVNAQRTARANVSAESKRELSPLPYTLRTFQQDANKRFKWAASKSLKVLQATYLAGYTTYPRTDIPYLRDGQKGEVPGILEAIGKWNRTAPVHTLFSKTEGTPVLSDRLFDTSKVKEHHGIIPSKKPFEGIDKDTKGEGAQAYELIALRYLMALMPHREFVETRVIAEFGGRRFTAKADKTTVAGWRALDPTQDPNPLPALQDGDTLQLLEARLVAKKTTPPKPYTEATLLGDMSEIAKFVENPVLKEKLKETSGIGTPATQAETIETIVQREYVYRKGSEIRSTELGRSLVDNMPSALVDPGVTALWEEALSNLEAGLISIDDFMAKIEMFTERLIEEMKVRSKSTKISGAGAPNTPRREAGPGRKSPPSLRKKRAA